MVHVTKPIVGLLACPGCSHTKGSLLFASRDQGPQSSKLPISSANIANLSEKLKAKNEARMTNEIELILRPIHSTSTLPLFRTRRPLNTLYVYIYLL